MPDYSLQAIKQYLAQIDEDGDGVDCNTLECCCGRRDCESMRHNEGILDRLEHEIRLAAELGQALLLRHDEYVEEAERERRRFVQEIERRSDFERLVMELEESNRDLESRNKETVEENERLLKRLEALNQSLLDVDARNMDLASEVTRTESELQRLSSIVLRTQTLEGQLLLVEGERAEMECEMQHLERTSRTSDARWQRAERQIKSLQQQLDDMERASREELTKTERLVGRTQQGQRHKPVQGFISDLLATNASLESATGDLRQILSSTQEEVTSLREQLQHHSSLGDIPALSESLEELRDTASVGAGVSKVRKTVSQELHHHHHHHYYHPSKVSDVSSKPKRQSRRSLNVDLTHGLARKPLWKKGDLASSAEDSGSDSAHNTCFASYSNHDANSDPALGRSDLPVRSSHSTRDSGYFSHDTPREYALSLARSGRNANPLETPVRMRSNSCDSIFLSSGRLAPPLQCSPPSSPTSSLPRLLPLLLLPSAGPCLDSGSSISPIKVSPLPPLPPIAKLDTSTMMVHSRNHHDTIMNTNNNTSGRRPFASPVQSYNASGATSSVNVTFATACTGSSVERGQSGRRVDTLLRSAAAQKQQQQPLSAADSKRGVAGTKRRWAAYLPWSFAPTAIAMTDAPLARVTATATATVTATVTATNKDRATTAVSATQVDGEALREALNHVSVR